MTSSSEDESIVADNDVKQKIGRPALDPTKGPMRQSSSNKKRNLKRRNVKEKEKKREYISDLRRKAVIARRDRRNKVDENSKKNSS